MKLQICPKFRAEAENLKIDLDSMLNILIKDNKLDKSDAKIIFMLSNMPKSYGRVYRFSGIKGRHYKIKINPDYPRDEFINSVAHEIRHVKQYEFQGLHNGENKWFGIKFPRWIPYCLEPWEIDCNIYAEIFTFNFLRIFG